LGVGARGTGPQPPTPKPQTPIPNPQTPNIFILILSIIFI